MSGPNAAMALPPDERPTDLQRPGDDDAGHLMPGLALQDQPAAMPGVDLELAVLGQKLNAMQDTYVELKFAAAQGNRASVESHLKTLSLMLQQAAGMTDDDKLKKIINEATIIALHARKTVTKERVRNRTKE